MFLFDRCLRKLSNLSFVSNIRERKFSPKFFWLKFLKIPWGHGRPHLRVMNVSAPKCLFFKDLRGLTEILGQDIRANDPRMSAGYPSQNLPLWAAFPHVNDVLGSSFPDPFPLRLADDKVLSRLHNRRHKLLQETRQAEQGWEEVLDEVDEQALSNWLWTDGCFSVEAKDP